MMNMKEMLGEAGRSMSNLDMLKNQNMREIMGERGRTISNMDRIIAAGMGQAMMSDNEPMMQDRSPENQIFSINAQIENLKKSYNMLVNAQEFDRAQEVANQINMLDVQKTQIQAQNVPSNVDILSSVPSNILKQVNMQTLLGESGKTISNQDRETISSLLESISI